MWTLYHQLSGFHSGSGLHVLHWDWDQFESSKGKHCFLFVVCLFVYLLFTVFSGSGQLCVFCSWGAPVCTDGHGEFDGVTFRYTSSQLILCPCRATEHTWGWVWSRAVSRHWPITKSQQRKVRQQLRQQLRSSLFLLLMVGEAITGPPNVDTLLLWWLNRGLWGEGGVMTLYLTIEEPVNKMASFWSISHVHLSYLLHAVIKRAPPLAGTVMVNKIRLMDEDAEVRVTSPLIVALRWE